MATIDNNELTGFIVTPTAPVLPTFYVFEGDTRKYNSAIARGKVAKKGLFGSLTLDPATTEYTYTKNRKFQEEIDAATEAKEAFVIEKKNDNEVLETTNINFDFTSEKTPETGETGSTGETGEPVGP